MNDAGDITQADGPWYFGEYENTIDKQRRVAIPSDWRSESEENNQFVLLPGHMNSLQLIPMSGIRELFNRLRQAPISDKNSALARAVIGSSGQRCQCDKQGRIKLPGKLVEYAQLADRAKLVGALTTIQIWHPDAWSNSSMGLEEGLDILKDMQEKPDALSDILSNLGAS